jgi:hypothetical protein
MSYSVEKRPFRKKETNMKKILIVFALALALGLAFYPVAGESQMMRGYGPHGGGWYCPNCGSQMCGGGWGRGYGPPSQYQQPQKPVDEKEAVSIVQGYLQSSRNPNLKTGSVKDAGNVYEVDVTTKDNALVDKILVDKYSGAMRSAY